MGRGIVFLIYTFLQPPEASGGFLFYDAAFKLLADDTNTVVRMKVRGTILGAQARITGIINQGIREGEFRKTFDAKEFSIRMMTMIEGGMLIGRVLGSNTQMTVVIRSLKKEIESQLE